MTKGKKKYVPRKKKKNSYFLSIAKEYRRNIMEIDHAKAHKNT